MTATSQFDPYHKWFGIPADEQPPNHYRLLRIALFEFDAEVIENAYDKEMADLKAQEHGQHGDLVESISRELVATYNCLHDAEKKAAYDTVLCEELRTEADGNALAADQALQTAIDMAVLEATADLLDERNRLRTLAEQASARQRQVLLEVRQLRSEVEQRGGEDAGTAAQPKVLGRGVESNLPKVIATPGADERSVRGVRRLPILAACMATLKTADRLLAKLAGEGNTLLHRFLRVIVAVLPVLVLAVVVWLMMRAPKEQTNSASAGGETTELEKEAKSFHAENQSPELAAFADVTVVVGDEISMIARANDPDDEDAALRFSLPGAPAGARIDAATGQFQWTPTDNQAGQSYQLTVRVQDDGTPAGVDEKSFMLTVLLPGIGTQAGQARDDNGLKMKFCWCPPGKFTMGSPADEPDRSSNEDQVAVTLSHGFWLGKHEVTQDQWVQVMGTRPWSVPKVKKGADYPATHVSWNDAMEFCKKLTEQERRDGRMPAGWQYTLPTEAQWEYACRAGSTARFSFGDDESRLSDFAWVIGNTRNAGEGYAHQVGVKRPNAWGLHDMHGNVWEWCRDWSESKLPGGTNPEGTLRGSFRVRRGGSWDYSAERCRSAYRGRFGLRNRGGNLGFRVVLSSVSAANIDSRASTPPLVGTRAGQERDDNGLKMKFCWCPPEKFTMGSPADEPGRNSNEDQVAVTLTHGLWLGKYEVTQDQWVQVMGTQPWSGKSNATERADIPATYVNWDDAMEFCWKLTELERRAGRLSADWQYTLPTEAEWEYACRAGSTTRFSFADDESRLGDFAWFIGNARNAGESFAHQVALKESNAWGLHDMHGNVYEWCRDWYTAKLTGGIDPEETLRHTLRVIRGGGWFYSAERCRSAYRGRSVPNSRDDDLGFRVARTPVAAANVVRGAVAPSLVGTRPGEERDDNGLKIEFCWCPPGKFTMGSPKDEPGRNSSKEDQVAVTLTRGFWLGKYEVTQDQWVRVMGTKPWSGRIPARDGAGNSATHMSWDDAKEFCQKLTDQERLAGRLPEDWQYTLPTEAEWEYACRAGSTTRFSFGDDESRLGEFAWFRGNTVSAGGIDAHQVGMKKSNAWGLHDMHGNVCEWCRDWYMAELPGGTNPEVTLETFGRVFRGGNCVNFATSCRSACRSPSPPSARGTFVGFRVSRSSVK